MMFLVSCKTKDAAIEDMEIYEGPIKVFENIHAYYSDSANVKMQMTAPKHEVYENQDQVYPDGVYIELFDDVKVVSTIIKSKEAFYYEKLKQYKLIGEVVVESKESGDKLNTEELYLESATGKIHTESFVTIISEGEVHTGEGLVSNGNFSKYRILKPSGTITVDEEF